MYDRGEPYAVDVTPDKAVYVCQCGLTKTPPFCDGSHSQRPGTGPLEHKAAKAGKVYVCGCGRSGKKPWCDGSHKKA